ncbi:MAG: hypothetical protein ACOYL1_01835, partial [Chlamydiia bacterium]
PSSCLRPLERLMEVAENRTNTSYLQQEAQGAKFQPAEMQKWVQEGEWISILKSLWSDEEGARALAWLRSKEIELLPPLLYEQAIAEFVQNPTFATASRISIPLIAVATLSLRQQQSLIQEKALEDPTSAEIFESKYFEKLHDLLLSKCKISLPELILSSDSSEHILRRVHKLAQTEDLPTPQSLKWLIHQPHTEEALKPLSEWPQLRQQVFCSWTEEWQCGPTLKFLRYFR